jgi:hypothetical protein
MPVAVPELPWLPLPGELATTVPAILPGNVTEETTEFAAVKFVAAIATTIRVQLDGSVTE